MYILRWRRGAVAKTYALILAGNVFYLAPAVLERQDPRSGWAIYRVQLPDRDMMVAVGDVSTVTLYAKLGRMWQRLDSVIVAVPSGPVATAVEGAAVAESVRGELVDVTKSVVETARLISHALGSLPAILPLALEFKRRPGGLGGRWIMWLILGGIMLFALMMIFGGMGAAPPP
jgi:hypothetical protein